MDQFPISESREREVSRWAQIAAGLFLGLLVLICGFASATLMFDLNRKTPLLLILISVILFLGCLWVLGKCVRLVIGRRIRGGLMSPRALRVVAFFLLVLPITGFFTGYYRQMGPVAVFLATMYVFGFFRLLALARERKAGVVVNRVNPPEPAEETNRPT